MTTPYSLPKSELESRGGRYVFNAVDGAESCCGKGEVFGDAEHDCVVKFRSLFVETPHRCGAYIGVKTGEDIQHNTLSA